MTARHRRARRFHHDIERGSTRPNPERRSMPGGRDQRVKLPVYKNLLEINPGFDQVIRGLGALRKHGAFLEQREE
jgi:hypothetical protein